MMKRPVTADAVARCLQLLDHADGDVQLQALLQTQSGGPVTVDWHWHNNHEPTWAACYHADWTLILIAGCASYDQAALTVFGYLAPRTSIGLSERTQNEYFLSCATFIFNTIRGRPGLQNQPLMIGGHSLGGCIGQSLAWLLRTTQAITDNCQICTFGSPKWAWRWQQDQIASIPQARWMNTDDPVPLVYPTISDFLPFLLQYTVTQAQGVSRYTQAAGGLVIAPNGDIAGGNYPTLTAAEWQVSMAGWLWDREQGGPTNPHSLAQYRMRLQAFIARDMPPREQPRPAEHIAPIEEHNRRLVNRAEAVVERRLAVAEAQQREQILHVPRERLVRAERRGRLWCVVWNDQVITVLVRRRSAYAVARSCNDFLHHLLNAGLVEPDTVVEQLRNFLGAAQDPTSGITPTINTVLPNELV